MTDVNNSSGGKKVWLSLLGIFKKLTNRSNLWHKIVFSGLRLCKHYDISIGFRQSPVSYWLAKYKCDSDVAVGFWHTDSDFENIDALRRCMHYPDKICCVSNAITEQMKTKFPALKEKFCTVYNLFDAEKICHLANETIGVYDDSFFNIVTVGRLSPPKKLTVIPRICAELKRQNLRFKWYVVGEGEERSKIEQLITNNDIADCLLLLGAKSNPYPYIKQADLFVLTSVWESYGMVVTEALILGTPVVAGDYPALHEILKDGINGIIASNNAENIGEAVCRVISEPEEYAKIKKGAEIFTYSADYAVNQLLSLKESL